MPTWGARGWGWREVHESFVIIACGPITYLTVTPMGILHDACEGRMLDTHPPDHHHPSSEDMHLGVEVLAIGGAGKHQSYRFAAGSRTDGIGNSST